MHEKCLFKIKLYYDFYYQKKKLPGKLPIVKSDPNLPKPGSMKVGKYRYFLHPGYGGQRIYMNKKPVILACDLAFILQDKLNDRYVIHVSIYPNQNTKIYGEIIKGLHYNETVTLQDTRWAYIYDLTGAFISIPMSQIEAEKDRANLKKWLITYQHEFLTHDQPTSKKNNFAKAINYRKMFSTKPEVSIFLTKAIAYHNMGVVDLTTSGKSIDIEIKDLELQLQNLTLIKLESKPPIKFEKKKLWMASPN